MRPRFIKRPIKLEDPVMTPYCRPGKTKVHIPVTSETERVPKHGTINEYNAFGCRCSECKAAIAKKNRECRARRKLRNGNPKNS